MHPRDAMRYSPPRAALIFIAALSGAPHLALAAEMDSKAVQIVAKTFDFLSHKPGANAKVVVIGDAADLAAVRASLAGMTVSAGKTADAVGAFAVFVNGPDEARAAREANGRVITIAGNVDCVTEGACLMTVETQPKVTIYVSRAAAQASGVEFDPNFRMLITEK